MHWKELWNTITHGDSIDFMTHRKNNLYPAWQDFSYLLWLLSLQFSSSVLCCFIPNIFHVRLREMQSMQIPHNPLWLHICTEKLQTGLTIFQSWPLEWCCLLSEWNWFPCTVPSQTAPAVWPLQTISPWTIRAKPQRRSNRCHGATNGEYE